MRLQLGSPVRCADEPFGELTDVVVDPRSRRVTHLVVAPHHRHDRARLVPIEWASGDAHGLTLARTAAEVDALDPVEASEYLRLGRRPVTDPDWDVGVETYLALPVFQELDGMGTAIDPDPHTTVTYDRIPKGEAEIRRSSSVISADDHFLGHVDGFLVSGDGPFADVVLARGHLWGHREIVIPYAAVARVQTDSVTLSLTKDAVGALPARRVHRWF